MFLQQFYSKTNQHILISAEQASLFAKEVAGDFNPLHDPDSKRFCVPGDLLFSLVIAKYGLNQKMRFNFLGMVGHNIYLNFPETDAANFEITDDKGKTYMQIERSGESILDEQLLEVFIRDYVAFSGPNFPHVLVPLMEKHAVMINTARPLVIYESMSFEFEHLNFNTPKLKASENTLSIQGKRGDARLHFQITSENQRVGAGFKKLLISGMKDYDKSTIESFVENYLALKSAYKTQAANI